MRVVVSGGTGFVGQGLVHALTARGVDVVVLTRGRAQKVQHACAECRGGTTAELVTWSPDAPGDWMRVVDGADAVVHLAGASVVERRWTPERKAVIRSSRVRTTELLAEAIAAADAKPGVFVSCSAVGYYGKAVGDKVLSESDGPGDDFLARVVVDWEAAAQRARDAGVRTVHPRIGVVLGKGGGALEKLLPAFRAFVGGPLGSGTQYVPWIHLRDTVRALEAMIDRADLQGPYNVTAPEPVTMNEFAKTLGKVIRRPSLVRVPSLVLRAAMGEASEVLLTGQRALPRRLVDAGFAFLFPDLRSALADLV